MNVRRFGPLPRVSWRKIAISLIVALRWALE
jgi:hypothetical protein